MKKGNEITPNKRTYGWALIFIFIVIAGTLAYYSDSLLPEKFNPDLHFNSELHDCTGWEVNYFLRWGETDSKGNAYALPPDCNELHNDVGGLVGWDCPSHNCVSWQPKEEEKIYVVEVNGTNYSITEGRLWETYCHDNPDSERCECTKFANSQHSINYTFGIDEIQTIQNLYVEVVRSENFPPIHPRGDLLIKIKRLDNQGAAEYQLPEQGADIFSGERSSTCQNKYEDCQVTEYDRTSGKAIRMNCVQKTEYTCKSLKTEITLLGSTCVEAVPK